MKTSLTKPIFKRSDTPDVTESKARFNSQEHGTRKAFTGKARSPTPNSSSTPRGQPRPMPKPQPKGRKLQGPREDRFWETKPTEGAARQIGKSTFVTLSPHENCFAGLLKMTREPLADKDVNTKSTLVSGVTPLLPTCANFFVECCYGQGGCSEVAHSRTGCSKLE